MRPSPPVRTGFDPTRALPNVSFRDPEWLAAEKRGIWHGDWVFVTTEDALPSPGDQLPVKVGDQPVLLLRNQAGRLAALSNLCAHRGTLLVEQPANGKRIQCPYHAWTYDDAGRLLGAPFAPEVMSRQGGAPPGCVSGRDLARPRLREPRPGRGTARGALCGRRSPCVRARDRRAAAPGGPADDGRVGMQLEGGHPQCDGELPPLQGPPRHARALDADEEAPTTSPAPPGQPPPAARTRARTTTCSSACRRRSSVCSAGGASCGWPCTPSARAAVPCAPAPPSLRASYPMSSVESGSR